MYGPSLSSGTTKSGAHITLTPPSSSHIEKLVAWLSTEEVMKHLNPDWQPTTAEQEQETLKTFEQAKDSIHWDIVVDSKPVGAAWINEIDHTFQWGSFGLLIGEQDAWGMGIGTEVARAVCDYAFSQTTLHSIKIAFTKENIGSKKIAEKLGFTLTPGVAHFTDGKSYPGWDGVLLKPIPDQTKD